MKQLEMSFDAPSDIDLTKLEDLQLELLAVQDLADRQQVALQDLADRLHRIINDMLTGD